MTTGATNKTPSSRQRRPRSSIAAAPSAPPSIAVISEAREATRGHRRAKRTLKGYDGYVAAGRVFLGIVVEQQRNNPSDVGREDVDLDLLEKAFDNPPNKTSVRGLEMFIIQKCVVERRKPGTGYSVMSAWANFWDNMDGDKYAGPYRYDEVTDTVHGCPARSITIKNLLKSLERKAVADGTDTREHAVAIKIEQLKQIMDRSETQFPSEAANDQPRTVQERRTKVMHLMMRAFMPSAFTLWTRIFEACKIQARHIKREYITLYPENPFFEVFLEDRKGYEGRAGLPAEESLESNHYNIYKQDVAAIDMYTHLLRWLNAYEELLGRPLLPDEYVFPFISSNGTIDPDTPMSHDVAQSRISEFVTGAGLPDIFTTHSFRRGGAQYRFTLAPFGKRWSLNQIRWWGGWAEGENVDTLMKYLIDSLNCQEKSHKDLLNPMGPREMDQSFNGDHTLLRPVTVQEFRTAREEFRTAHEEIMTTLTNGTTATNAPTCAALTNPPYAPPSAPIMMLPLVSSMPPGSSATSATSQPLASAAMDTDSLPFGSHSTIISSHHPLGPSPTIYTIPGPPPQQVVHVHSLTTNVGNVVSAPFASSSINASNPPRQASQTRATPVLRSTKENHLPPAVKLVANLGPARGGWRRALDQWYNPDKRTGVAIKDWEPDWYQGKQKKAIANLRSQRHAIAAEFEDCGKDEAAFFARYPDADDQTVTELRQCIRNRYGRRRNKKNS